MSESTHALQLEELASTNNDTAFEIVANGNTSTTTQTSLVPADNATLLAQPDDSQHLADLREQSHTLYYSGRMAQYCAFVKVYIWHQKSLANVEYRKEALKSVKMRYSDDPNNFAGSIQACLGKIEKLPRYMQSRLNKAMQAFHLKFQSSSNEFGSDGYVKEAAEFLSTSGGLRKISQTGLDDSANNSIDDDDTDAEERVAAIDAKAVNENQLSSLRLLENSNFKPISEYQWPEKITPAKSDVYMAVVRRTGDKMSIMQMVDGEEHNDVLNQLVRCKSLSD